MRSSAYSVVFLGLALYVAPTVRGAEGWYVEFLEGKAAAESSGKDMLIDFGGSDWCAPCKWLKERVLSRPEFIDQASPHFVLVDIDLLMRKGAPIPADRKERYEKLQERYGIATFPSVLLTTPDGRAYARTTYREKTETPKLFWEQLGPLKERGERLRAALDRADKLQGRLRASALVDGLSEVDARFVTRFFADRVADLRSADPSDPTGYLAFLDGRRAIDEYEAGLDNHKPSIDAAAVQSLIDRAGLHGESLQQMLIVRAAGEVLAGQDRQGLRTLAAALDAQTKRTRFDRGDFVPLDAQSIAAVRRRIADAEADSGDGVALYYSLHRIFEFDMPNAYEISCGQGFRPEWTIRPVISEKYGQALIRSTESLQGEARARALAKGLDGTFFGGGGSISKIVRDLIPSLVGKETARAILPGKYYPRWVP